MTQSHQKGFVLTEGLVVQVPIGILCAALLASAGLASYELGTPSFVGSRCKTAWYETQTISQAVDAYKTDNNGDCPKSIDVLASERYLAKPPVDPWGQPFQLRCPGDINPDGVDIWSNGRNGESGDEDDVRSWVLTWEQTCRK